MHLSWIGALFLWNSVNIVYYICYCNAFLETIMKLLKLKGKKFNKLLQKSHFFERIIKL